MPRACARAGCLKGVANPDKRVRYCSEHRPPKEVRADRPVSLAGYGDQVGLLVLDSLGMARDTDCPVSDQPVGRARSMVAVGMACLKSLGAPVAVQSTPPHFQETRQERDQESA